MMMDKRLREKLGDWIADYTSLYGTYSISDRSFVDIHGDLECYDDSLPFPFGKISGDFSWTGRDAVSLSNCPDSVQGRFNCRSNRLVDLRGGPKHVNGDYVCSDNHLAKLTGAPQKVGGGFFCGQNNLETLAGAPAVIGGSFSCRANQLTSLAGASKTVTGNFSCDWNHLTTLAGAPSLVQGDFDVTNNPLASLDGIGRVVGVLKVTWNKQLPLLGLFRNSVDIGHLSLVVKDDNIFAAKSVETIINQYLPTRNFVNCAARLTRAGYAGNAVL